MVERILIIGAGEFTGAPLIDNTIEEGLVTTEKVNIRFYRSSKSEKS